MFYNAAKQLLHKISSDGTAGKKMNVFDWDMYDVMQTIVCQ